MRLMVTMEHAHAVDGLGSSPVALQLVVELVDQVTQTGTVTSVVPASTETQLTLSAVRTTQVARPFRSPHMSSSASPTDGGSDAATQLPRRPALAAVKVELSVLAGVSVRKYTPRSYLQEELEAKDISTYTLAKEPLPAHVPTCEGPRRQRK